MATTLIRAYQTHFTLIDVEGDDSSRVFSVGNSAYYSQVILSKENVTNPRLFFMADLPSQNNLILDVYSVSTSGTGDQTVYSLDSKIKTYEGELNYLNQPLNESLPFSDARWYYVDTDLSLEASTYYALVFRYTDISGVQEAPKIYYSKEYRKEIFPIMMSSIDQGTTYSNENVPVSSNGTIRTGSIVCGFTGKEVTSSDEFDSGSNSIGGVGSARRGYPTFLYVENISSSANEVSLQFLQTPPTDMDIDGTSQETDQALMRWFYYKPGTLPLSGKSFLNRTISSYPVLDNSANFIIFTQPDRLPPYPKVYFPETYMGMTHKEVGVVSIYEGYKEDKHRVQRRPGIIQNNDNRSELDYWAHFSEMRKEEVDSSGERKSYASSNPSYLDFSLEKKGKEIELFGEIQLTNDGVDNKRIRGFTNITKIGKYNLGFGKYETYSDDWYDASPKYTTADGGIILKGVISHEDTPDQWESIDIKITSDYTSGDTDLILGDRDDDASKSNRIIGVHDTKIVKNADGDSVLFAIFQAFPEHTGTFDPSTDSVVPTRAFFNLAVSSTNFNTDTTPNLVTFKVMEVADTDEYDGRFISRNLIASEMGITLSAGATLSSVDRKATRVWPDVDADYKQGFFFDSQLGGQNTLYFTVRNLRQESYDGRYGQALTTAQKNSKFAIWKIDLDFDVDSDFDSNSITATKVESSTYENSASITELDYRGFDSEISQEIEISYALRDGNVGYFGTNVYGNAKDNTSTPKMAEVYTSENMEDFVRIIEGDKDSIWANDYTLVAEKTGGTTTQDFVNNDFVSYIAKVDDIVHVWTSPIQDGGFGTPFHIAYDENFNRTKILRKFPIQEEEDESRLSTTPPSYWENGDESAFPHNRKIRCFMSGIRNGDYIVLIGQEGYNNSSYESTFPHYDYSIKTIIYDAKTINDAFYYHGDTSYKIDPNIDASVIANDASANDEFVLKAPYKEIEYWGTKWGVYHHKTLTKYPFEPQLVKKYPALKITRDNPRIGIYCGMATSSKFIHNVPGSINDDFYNLNPRIFVQAGIIYILCDNTDKGIQLFKIYGIKQKPEDWGLTNTHQGSIGTNFDAYNYKVDYPCFEVATSGTSPFEEIAQKAVVSNNVRLNIISSLKNDNDSGDDDNDIDPTVLFRNFLRLTAGISLPQNISFYYNLRETPFQTTPIYTEEDLETNNLTRNLPSDLQNPDKTVLVLKYADTLENLYLNAEELTINLAQARNGGDLFSNIMFFSRALPTDIDSNFFRLESQTLILKDNTDSAYYYVKGSGTGGAPVSGDEISVAGTTIDDPFAEVLIKSLTFSDVDFKSAVGSISIWRASTSYTASVSKVYYDGLQYIAATTHTSGSSFVTDLASGKWTEIDQKPEKDVVVNGIVYAGNSKDPSEIFSENLNAGVVLAPDNEIVITFPKPIYINSVVFDAFFDGQSSGQADLSRFTIYNIPSVEKQTYGEDLYGPDDWKEVGTILFDPETESKVEKKNISQFTKAIKIKLDSGVILRVNGLKIKSFAEQNASTFVTSGTVKNAELIVVDDLRGLQSSSSNLSKAVATMSENSSITIDFEKEIPCTRISANLYNIDSRSIRVETAGSDGVFSTLFSGAIQNYEYALCRWFPREKQFSRQVDIKVLSSITDNDPDSISDELPEELIDFLVLNHQSNFSTYFGTNQLTGLIFRPNVFKSRNITIAGSSTSVSDPSQHGSILVNTQMDDGGFFSSDISLGLGMIERGLNLDFPLQNIEKVRITILDSGESGEPVKINGFKIYTPLVNSDGNFVTPLSAVNWNIQLRAFVSQ